MYAINFLFLCILIVAVSVPQAIAAEMQLWGKPLTIHGYLNQSVGVGISGEYFDTQKRFQSAIFQGLIEGTYEPKRNVMVFMSGKLNADWAYPALSNNTLWQEKGFDKSRDRLYMLDDFKDVLHEAHVTWRPQTFYFRVGKQIVRWGETDGFRLMDQINPVDQRRGLADVEFETTILPAWLARAEYAVANPPEWCQGMSFQAIFNPNLEFRPNESIKPGNDFSGIWAPYLETSLGGRYPLDFARIGSPVLQLEEPSGSDGFEYALRARAVVHDAAMTLNYYYGRDKDPVAVLAGPAKREISQYDGRLTIHPNYRGFYPRFRFIGGTFTKDIDALQSTFLGGVAPLFRFEAFYAFNKTFASDFRNIFTEHDEVRWAAGADWKVKIDALNPIAFFTISPQFYHRKIVGYPDNDTLSGPNGEPLRENNYQASLMISTSYMGGKLQPSVFWLRNISEQADFVRPQLTYSWSHHWRYTLGAIFFDGEKEKKSYQQFKHKDQVYFTVSYRF
jgi:hypothetical protein